MKSLSILIKIKKLNRENISTYSSFTVSLNNIFSESDKPKKNLLKDKDKLLKYKIMFYNNKFV